MLGCLTHENGDCLFCTQMQEVASVEECENIPAKANKTLFVHQLKRLSDPVIQVYFRNW